MKTYKEMAQYLKENGYSMEEAISGYFYCIQTDEDGNTNVVWMDSACEDAYDLESATSIAYDIITNN